MGRSEWSAEEKRDARRVSGGRPQGEKRVLANTHVTPASFHEGRKNRSRKALRTPANAAWRRRGKRHISVKCQPNRKVPRRTSTSPERGRRNEPDRDLCSPSMEGGIGEKIKKHKGKPQRKFEDGGRRESFSDPTRRGPGATALSQHRCRRGRNWKGT